MTEISKILSYDNISAAYKYKAILCLSLSLLSQTKIKKKGLTTYFPGNKFTPFYGSLYGQRLGEDKVIKCKSEQYVIEGLQVRLGYEQDLHKSFWIIIKHEVFALLSEFCSKQTLIM